MPRITSPDARVERKSIKTDDVFTPAVRAFHDNTAEARVQRKNAQIFSMVMAAVAGLAIFNSIIVGQQPRTLPYVIEVDKRTGEVAAVGNPPRLDQVPANILTPVIQITLARFIRAVRSVDPTKDFQQSLFDHEVHPFLQNHTKPTTLVSDFYHTNDPYTLGAKEIVDVTVDVPIQQTAYTYALHWVEKTENLDGTITSQQEWEGYAAVEMRDVPIDQRDWNPFGIYLTNLSWQPKLLPSPSPAR